MKQQAKEILKQNPPTKITLLFLLSTMGLSLVINLFVPNQIYDALVSGDVTVLNQGGTVVLFLTVLVILFSWLMNYGYRLWALRTARGEEAPYSTLIEGFGHVGSVMCLSILKVLFMYFWLIGALMCCMLPFSFFATFLFSMPYGEYGIILSVLWLSFMLIAGIFFLYLRYCMASFFLADAQNKSASIALRGAVNLQRNSLKELFKLHLGFWRWGLLYFLTVLLYSGLTVGLNYLTNPGDLEDLLFTGNDIAYWISVVVDWIFLLKFCPLYYVTLALFYHNQPEKQQPTYHYNGNA